MALNDLTPQLRTRLGRVERFVGLFVLLATLLMLTGFSYYLWHTAQRKGWLLSKQPFFTFVLTGTGLKVGDPVKIMGFTCGEITKIEPQSPTFYLNIYVEFVVRGKYHNYVWNDSKAQINSADFLGGRFLEVTKGGTSGRTNGLFPIYDEKEQGGKKVITGIWAQKTDNYGHPDFSQPGAYKPWKAGDKGYWLPIDETPALTERLDTVVKKVEEAMPNFLALTNRLQLVFDNAAAFVSNANVAVAAAQPAASNLAVITGNLRDPKGSLGEWLFPVDTKVKLDTMLTNASTTLASANTLMQSTDTNLATTLSNLNLTLLNLADITSNLHSQIDQNTNLVTGMNQAILHADDLMQGLKKHWLLRSAFKTNAVKTNTPPVKAKK